jgi:uncharacterized NAD(P)/FAD-binding protein YdhS
VIGTSLSAIETALTLCSDGTFLRGASGELVFTPSGNPRRLTLYSRRGLLPKVRGRRGNYRNTFFTREKIRTMQREGARKVRLENLFRLLDSDLRGAYGHPLDWAGVLDPKGAHQDLLAQYLRMSRQGDGPEGDVLWQTVLSQTFPLLRDIYAHLEMEERELFEREYSAVFFAHAATQPYINAEKLLALIKSGVVRVYRLGTEYGFQKNGKTGDFEFVFRPGRGHMKRNAHRYVVNARGQSQSVETDPSLLTRNLLESGMMQILTCCPMRKGTEGKGGEVTGKDRGGARVKTGSVWIDPQTHRILHSGSEAVMGRSQPIYAVGAMTRGQIIDTSMAQGLARSTARAAAALIDSLIIKST